MVHIFISMSHFSSCYLLGLSELFPQHVDERHRHDCEWIVELGPDVLHCSSNENVIIPGQEFDRIQWIVNEAALG